MQWFKTKRTPISLILHDSLYLFVMHKTGSTYTIKHKKCIEPEQAGIAQGVMHNPSFFACSLFNFLHQQNIAHAALALATPQDGPAYTMQYRLWSAHYNVPIAHLRTHDIQCKLAEPAYAQLACALWQGDYYGE